MSTRYGKVYSGKKARYLVTLPLGLASDRALYEVLREDSDGTSYWRVMATVAYTLPSPPTSTPSHESLLWLLLQHLAGRETENAEAEGGE